MVGIDEKRMRVLADRAIKRSECRRGERLGVAKICQAVGQIDLVAVDIADDALAIILPCVPLEPVLVPIVDLDAEKHAKDKDDEIDRAMRTSEGTTIWYLRVIHHLAQNNEVWTLDISGEEWGEVDFPEDVASAETLARGWA